ncbi:MAG: alcohol dehydrogenase catalytic domain-containing protein [Frankiales bacterium]|nr:alcohol dehydrogenase catalytic domain-containing protein [Frankiales bacterium]
MRAVVWESYGATPTVREVPEPECPEDAVVVEVAATGVCRSDWHAWQGHDPVPSLPWVPGHELAGTVVAAGAGVRRWRGGERVTTPFACGCGRCPVCAAGDAQVCAQQTQPGFTHWGSFAERVVVRAADTNLVALPDDVSFVDAAPLGCRFATAYRAVAHQGRVADGEWLAVHGCGGVGLSAVMTGVARGARVVAVDVSPAALDAARSLGAEAVVQVDPSWTPQQVGDAVRDATHGGAHVSVDALGGTAAMSASVASLRRRGRHVQVGLMLGADSVAPAPMGRVIAEELVLVGSHGMAARDYPAMLDLVASGALDVHRLVGRVVALDDAPAALVAMGGPPVGAGITVVDLSL